MVCTPCSCPGNRADTPHQFDGQGVQEFQFTERIDNHQPVGFCDLRGDFGQVLGARDADGDRKTDFRTDALTDRSCNVGRRAKQMRAAGDIQKRLVDRDPLDERRKIIEHLDDCVA
jgi:hypothetical protein